MAIGIKLHRRYETLRHETLESPDRRKYWLFQLERLALPILESLVEEKLKERMPVETVPGYEEERALYTHLEAFGRLLCGIAPWISQEHINQEEEQRRQYYAHLCRKALDSATNTNSADFMNFTEGGQPIVDAAFLAQGLLRGKGELWDKLDSRVKNQVIQCLKSTRSRKPNPSNWLLFSAIIEVFLYVAGEEDWDPMRIDYALLQHEQWYVGDGAYGDGADFHWDYYNSFVISPMLVDIIEQMHSKAPEWEILYEPIMARARRYGGVLERLVAPDGSFPIMGRSMPYRCGAFHALAQSVLLERWPQHVEPAQVREALTAVINRTLDAPETFTTDGWLRIGLCGSQPQLAEQYLSTGSLYLCSAVLLPLGLPEQHPFWQQQAIPWTSAAGWSGASIPLDKALKN